jgi:hypothetical protein
VIPLCGSAALVNRPLRHLTKRGRIGASFIKRGDAHLGDPTVLWRTVAFDLAQFHPALKASIVEFMDQPSFRDADILLYFECLIEDVLRENCERLSAAPPVIVLDALDECGLDESNLA